MDAEKKLAEYRAKKRREERIKWYKEKFTNIFSWKNSTSESRENEALVHTERENVGIQHGHSETIISENFEDISPKRSALRIEFYILFFILWAATFYLFIQLQFGIVFLIMSGIFGIYFNTRTGQKDKNEVSAYSVFNKNCESIAGTLKAEQFEREIRFGSMNVH